MSREDGIAGSKKLNENLEQMTLVATEFLSVIDDKWIRCRLMKELKLPMLDL